MNSSSVLACVGAEFNKPFVQTSQATYFCPQNRHSLLAETNPCPVDFANQFHRRMLVLPGHRTRKPHNGLHAVEQIAIPAVFQQRPDSAPPDCIYCGKADSRPVAKSDRFGQRSRLSGQETASEGCDFRSIIAVEQQGCHERKAAFVSCLPLAKNVHRTIACHFRSHGIQRQFASRTEEQAHRRHPGRRVKIVLGGMDFHTVLATARIRADRHDGFGIEGKPQRGWIGIGVGIDLAQSLENGVGLNSHFCGLFLTLPEW